MHCFVITQVGDSWAELTKEHKDDGGDHNFGRLARGL